MRVKPALLFVAVLVVVGGFALADEPTSAVAPETAVSAVPEWTAVGWVDFAKGQDPLAVFDLYNAQGWEVLLINFPVGTHQTSYREIAVGKTWPVAADDKGVVLAGGYLDRWLFCDQNYIAGRLIVDRQVGHGWRMFVDNVIYAPISGGGTWAYYNPQSSLTHPLEGNVSGGVAATVWDAEGVMGGDFARVGPVLQYTKGSTTLSAMYWWDISGNDAPPAFRVRCDVPF